MNKAVWLLIGSSIAGVAVTYAVAYAARTMSSSVVVDHWIEPSGAKVYLYSRFGVDGYFNSGDAPMRSAWGIQQTQFIHDRLWDPNISFERKLETVELIGWPLRSHAIVVRNGPFGDWSNEVLETIGPTRVDTIWLNGSEIQVRCRTISAYGIPVTLIPSGWMNVVFWSMVSGVGMLAAARLWRPVNSKRSTRSQSGSVAAAPVAPLRLPANS